MQILTNPETMVNLNPILVGKRPNYVFPVQSNQMTILMWWLKNLIGVRPRNIFVVRHLQKHVQNYPNIPKSNSKIKKRI